MAMLTGLMVLDMLLSTMLLRTMLLRTMLLNRIMLRQLLSVLYQSGFGGFDGVEITEIESDRVR